MKLKLTVIASMAFLLSACSNSGAPTCTDSDFKEDFLAAYKQQAVDNVTKWMGEEKGQKQQDYVEYTMLSIVTEEKDEEAKRSICRAEVKLTDHEEGGGSLIRDLMIMAYRQEDGSLAYRTKEM